MSRLRFYQQEAVDAAIAHMKKSLMPGLLELSGGAGKSHIMAAIAKWVYESTGKRVLCLQPTKELCTGNAKKYLATGSPASIFSASSGSKCLRHPCVFATPGTVANSISRFGDQFGAVLVDEAHRTTEQVKAIISAMRAKNQRLRVIGMTGSPYRFKTGFIYSYDVDGSFVPEDQAINPYYNNLLYRITTRELVDLGFLTPMHADPSHVESYDTSSIKLKQNGKFDDSDVERVFEGRGRLTYNIVSDIVGYSRGHSGVMIFAATVQHAKEIMESLPPENSRMLGGDVNMGSERDGLIKDFENKKFKYLVSVGTLTTGVDFPHVSIIAVMRAIESPGLFQQILWRGVRLISDSVAGDIEAIAKSEKPEAILLDYGENIERFNLHSDLFAPRIRVKGASSGSAMLDVKCPECGFKNEFSARKNDDEFEYSEDGYFLDLNGQPIETDHGPLPSHHGRRCTGQVRAGMGMYDRCDYRWTSKECPECQADNDIAARYCCACKCEIVDPHAKLVREFTRVKKDPYAISTDPVLNWTLAQGVSQSGNDTLRIDYTTEYRTFPIWYTPGANSTQAVADWEALSRAVYRGHVAPDIDMFLEHIDKGAMPETITYARRRGTDFYRVHGYNRPADRMPEQ
ncbi:MAG: DEAD/DEAH box helicase family protein [Porticoccaceae bacterium]|nr:DEAD/DEAH box helicase family protein [Porticoccaceae bacterium]